MCERWLTGHAKKKASFRNSIFKYVINNFNYSLCIGNLKGIRCRG